jgi:HSP20 family protein
MPLDRCPILSRKNWDDYFFPRFFTSFLTPDPIITDLVPKTITDRHRFGAFHPTPLSSMMIPAFPSSSSSSSSSSSPFLSTGYDIREYKDKYQIEVDLPGIKASDMNVELEQDGRVLHIFANRKRETEDAHGNISLSESRMDKRFTVGANIETEKMTGKLAYGVLTLVAPKKKKVQAGEKVTTKKIPISEDKKKKSTLGPLKIQSKM